MVNKILLTILLWTPALGSVFADDGPHQRSKAAIAELEIFSGTWEIILVNPEGATQNAKWLSFYEDWTYAAKDENGEKLWEGTFDLDPEATPKNWDHRSNDSAKKNGDVLGIYEIDGSLLRVSCVAGEWKYGEWTGKPRPKDFDPKDSDVSMELKRSESNK